MNRTVVSRTLAAVLSAMLFCAAAQAAQSPEERSLNELRNTVVNLLQALVQKGVMTQEQAAALVQQAQTKAEQDAAAAAAQDEAEKGAVRVTHVPEMVKQEIRDQVTQEVKPQVVTEVLAAARNEKWGIPGALPEWVGRLKITGDIRLREQADIFASDNIPNTYADYNAINAAGGVNAAGTAAYINVTEDRLRTRMRARLGVESTMADGVKAAIRLSTGTINDPVSTNQTLGNYGGRYQVNVEQAYLRWDARNAGGFSWLSLQGGRMPNPWVSTDLLWDGDLAFDGVAGTYRFGLSGADSPRRHLFLTLGGFPLQEVELSKEDKWLYGAQLGIEWGMGSGSRLRLAGAFYDYENMLGQRNTSLNSRLLDFTAPRFLQRGNTLTNLRNSLDPDATLVGLAAEYTIVDLVASADLMLADDFRLSVTGNYLRNIGYDEEQVMARTPRTTDGRKRNEGYQGEFSVGSDSLNRRGAWRAFMGYRYLQRDAVLDAFTDSDFRGGGTDVKGYFIGGDLGLTRSLWMRMRYLSGSEIDGPPLGLDVWQFDINTQF